jgi:cyclopropane fatty-acyl-phospholipid synthase-like methyltransferase
LDDVWQLYETHAAAFDRDRGRSGMEEPYLLRAITRMNEARSTVLDLGCGAGEPIARYLLEAGCEVTGVDAAPAMIALCRARFPRATWIEHDMRTLALGRRFDAIVAWDSFFHLRKTAQRDMFRIFRDHIAPRGLLLFTSGPRDGEAIGDLYGHALYHASLDSSEYERLLNEHGFDVIHHRAEDPDCGTHTVWLAQSRH